MFLATTINHNCKGSLTRLLTYRISAVVLNPVFLFASAIFNLVDEFRSFALVSSTALLALYLAFGLADVPWVLSILLVVFPSHASMIAAFCLRSTPIRL